MDAPFSGNKEEKNATENWKVKAKATTPLLPKEGRNGAPKQSLY